MQVIKRNGQKVPFDFKKIEAAVNGAFGEVRGENAPGEFFSSLKSRVYYPGPDKVFSVEELQDMVETVLFREGFADVGVAYRDHRKRHEESRRFLEDRTAFIHRYTHSGDNAATSSETDPNANVTIKNVSNCYSEIYKNKNREMMRYQVEKKLEELYPEVSRQYVKDLEHHILYAHDEASSAVPQPYTYSPKEVVYALLNDEPFLGSLESLYMLSPGLEEPQKGQDGVWCKYPKNLFVKDNNGEWAKVSRLTKKNRHRDLVRVKTAFGEDLIVTDNHPMIISDDKNNTVQASQSNGEQQLRCNSGIEFSGQTVVDMAACVECDEVYENFVISHDYQTPYFHAKRFIKIDRDFGYVVGFFLGDGNYNNSVNHIAFTQKEPEVLKVLAEKIFEAFGVASNLFIDMKNTYRLDVCSRLVSDFFRNYLKIKDKAHNKCIPPDILKFNPDFAKGIIEGLIDSDGTIQTNDASVNIRIASRELVLQLTVLLRYFGYGVANSYQNIPFGCNVKIRSNYTMWGIIFTNAPGTEKFDGSVKWRNEVKREVDKYLKYKEGWSTITNVDKIERGSFLDSCQYIYDITTESSTFLCNNIWVHNCNAVSLYPFMQHGTRPLDGTYSTAPKNLSSFAGQFCNLIFLLSSQVKGAVAYGELFLAFVYYCRKDFGEGWHTRENELASVLPKRTIRETILQYFQQIVYTMNQPAGNRGYQSPFTNVSYYDKEYYKAIFDEFKYPDGTVPTWEEVDYIQRLFMNWFNEERTKSLLTFPVETMALLTDKDGAFRDPEYKKLTAQMYARGHSFFTYISDNPNALASCCRLRNEIKENTFSFSNGLTGVQTGSVNVITLNHARIIQDWARENGYDREFLSEHFFEVADSYKAYLSEILERVYKYHIAYKTLVYEMEEAGMITSCNEHYIAIRKLYSTIGDNGINEAAEFIGLECSYNEDYKRFCRLVVGTISELNKEHSTTKFLFNQEFVPAEGLSSKNLNWDKADGYWVPEGRILYNSYFYLADSRNTQIGDKFRLHGREFTELLDGGVGLHCNLQEHLTEAQYMRLLDYAVECGTSYFTFNIPNSECTNTKCHHIVKLPMETCPKCGAPMRQYTRVIGYLRPVDSFEHPRWMEAQTRWYAGHGALPEKVRDEDGENISD